MAAILQTSGPVSTHNATGRVRPFLNCVTTSQFDKAGRELEVAGFGKLVNMRTNVFVKTPPEEAIGSLMANPDLCSAEIYQEKYYRASPACITWKHRAMLVSMGLVPEKMFMQNMRK